MAESEEKLKRVLIKLKEESEKVGLKLNIQKTKIMSSGPITSWQIDGETMETVTDSIFMGSKITADGLHPTLSRQTENASSKHYCKDVRKRSHSRGKSEAMLQRSISTHIMLAS